MADLNFGIADITAAKQKDLDNAYKAQKKASAAQVAGTDPFDPIGNSRVVKAQMKPPAALPKSLKLDKASREAFMNKPKDAKAEGAQKARLLAIHEGYYKRAELKNFLPKKVNLTLSSSVTDMQAALAQVRQTMNAMNAGENMRKVVPKIVDLAISLLEKFNMLEQVGLKNAKGVDRALARALDSPVMQTEMSEMEVEYGHYFSAGVEVRFAIKIWLFIKAYSDAKDSAARPAGPRAAAAAAGPPVQ